MKDINFFHHKEGEDTQHFRIKTAAYKLDLKTGTLHYGGTVFRKDSSGENWNRKQHVNKALERLNSSPVVIKFGGLKKKYRKMGFFQYRRLEDFILKCFFRFGVEKPMRESSRYTDLLNADFSDMKDSIFDPELTSNEKTMESLYNESLYKPQKMEHGIIFWLTLLALIGCLIYAECECNHYSV